MDGQRLSERTRFLVNDAIVRKKTDDGRTTWIVQRNEINLFLLNDRTLFFFIGRTIYLNKLSFFTEWTILLNDRSVRKRTKLMENKR